MKERISERIGSFMAGKGFYIVLSLCVAAIGISGYFLCSSLSDPPQEVETAGHLQVTVTPPPQRVHVHPVTTAPPQPSAAPAPTSRPAPRPTAEPIPTAGPDAQKRPTLFTWPVKGSVIHPYSMETLAYDVTMGDWRTHEGVDLAAQQGEKVLAAADGAVTSVLHDDLMGTTITVDHGDGLSSVYANLSPTPLAEAGDMVKAGDVLGSVGSTAIAESALPSHLHFSMWENSLPVDPADYLPSR